MAVNISKKNQAPDVVAGADAPQHVNDVVNQTNRAISRFRDDISALIDTVTNLDGRLTTAGF